MSRLAPLPDLIVRASARAMSPSLSGPPNGPHPNVATSTPPPRAPSTAATLTSPDKQSVLSPKFLSAERAASSDTSILDRATTQHHLHTATSPGLHAAMGESTLHRSPFQLFREEPSRRAVPTRAAGSAASAVALADAKRYVAKELAVLGFDANDSIFGGAASSASSAHEASSPPNAVCQPAVHVARLAAFRGGWQLLGASVPAESRLFIERLFAEYDLLVASLEQQLRDRGVERHRQKLDEQYVMHYRKLVEEHDADIARRRKELDAAEQSVALKLRHLEAQTASLQEDNFKMRQSMAEDHERVLMMSQAVVESRLHALRAEERAKQASDQLERLHRADEKQADLVADHMEMFRLLKANKIDFTPKCRLAI